MRRSIIGWISGIFAIGCCLAVAMVTPLSCAPAPPKLNPDDVHAATTAATPEPALEPEPAPEPGQESSDPDIASLANELAQLPTATDADPPPGVKRFDPDTGEYLGEEGTPVESLLHVNGSNSFEFDPLADGPAENGSDAASYYAAVIREIGALRMDVQRLQDQMDAYAYGMVEELRSDNARLRRELDRLQYNQGQPMRDANAGARPSMSEPPLGPYDDPLARFNMVQQRRAEMENASAALRDAPPALDGGVAVPGSEPAGVMPQSPAATAVDDAPDGEAPVVAIGGDSGSNYAVIKEWGRNAEEAKRLAPDATSVKGMICALRDAGSRETLMELGRRLRSDYDDYDNINISVFDDIVAAREFAQTNDASLEPVIRIAKHAESGVDEITVMVNGAPVRLSPQGDGLFFTPHDETPPAE